MDAARPRDKDLKGWLKRKGGRMNTWSRRWFVLKDQFLFMFLREDDKKNQECFTLDGRMIVEPPPDAVDARQGYFDIVSESDKGSSETLSLCAETDDEKKIWVRALKRAMHAHKGGALFCQSLDEILYWERLSGRPVHIPYIVNECVEYLYKYGLDVEGLFRLPGRQSAIKDVISRFDCGRKINFEAENTDVHVVASVLKTFLRDLPESLIPCHLFQKFMNIALRFMESPDESAREVCVKELAEAMKLIPKDNYVVLKYVCRFLREVGLHEPTNKMSMMSLGTVFGYNLIRHIDKENSQLFLCTADLGQNLVFMLLNFFPQVFMLEYSDRGGLNNNVPTADLLRMSRIIDLTPAVLPNIHSAVADLEGIYLSFEASEQSPVTSSDNLNITDDHFSLISSKNDSEHKNDTDADNCMMTRSCDIVGEKKKNLHLSLSDHGGLGRSYSTPVSPNANEKMPPVPPRRTKSRITRNRNVVNKTRPHGITLDMDEISFGSGTSGSINSEDILMALAQVKTHNVHPSDSTGSSPASTPSHNSIILEGDHSSLEPALDAAAAIEMDGKVGPSIIDLKHQVTTLKDELSQQRDRYKTQITALKAQLSDMKEKYERRIETMEIEFKSQVRELENKLASERELSAAATADTARLKNEVHRYQMLYGDLT